MALSTAKRISKLENNLVKHIFSLSDQADRSSKRDISQDSALKKLVNQMIKSVMDKQADLKVAMETKVEGCNKKIESLGQKTNEIDAKMNRLLNLLGAEEDEQRPTQRTQTGLEWFKVDLSERNYWTCLSDPAFWSDDAKEDGARSFLSKRKSHNQLQVKREIRGRSGAMTLFKKDNSR